MPLKAIAALARKGGLLASPDRAVTNRVGPECGTAIAVVDCRRDSGARYAGYRCSLRSGDGQGGHRKNGRAARFHAKRCRHIIAGRSTDLIGERTRLGG